MEEFQNASKLRCIAEAAQRVQLITDLNNAAASGKCEFIPATLSDALKDELIQNGYKVVKVPESGRWKIQY